MACPKLLYDYDQEPLPFLGVWKKERLENADAHFLGTLEEKKSAENFCDSYLPFGLTFNHYQKDPPENYYRFQGQEHQPETGWDQYKWRNADPALGRFFNIDPLAEDYLHNSPYAFSENKVTAHVELEGLESFFAADGSVIHGPVSNSAIQQQGLTRIDNQNSGGLNNTLTALRNSNSTLSVAAGATTRLANTLNLPRERKGVRLKKLRLVKEGVYALKELIIMVFLLV